jgi:hypothetical protein
MFGNTSNMRNILCFIAVVMIGVLPSCKKVKENLRIDADVAYTQMVTVPTASIDSSAPFPAGGLVVPFPTIGVETDHIKYLQQYNTRSDKVTFVGLDLLTYRFKIPGTQNFDFLDSAQVFLSAYNLPEVFVGYINKVSTGQVFLNLKPIDGLNVKDYFLRDTMNFRILWFTHAMPPSGAQFEMKSSFNILADPI